MDCQHPTNTAAVSILKNYLRFQYSTHVFRAERVVEARALVYVQEPGTMAARLLANAHELVDNLRCLSKLCPACLTQISPKLVRLVEAAEDGRMVGLTFSDGHLSYWVRG